MTQTRYSLHVERKCET